MVLILLPVAHIHPELSGRVLHSSPSRHGSISHHHFPMTMEAVCAKTGDSAFARRPNALGPVLWPSRRPALARKTLMLPGFIKQQRDANTDQEDFLFAATCVVWVSSCKLKSRTISFQGTKGSMCCRAVIFQEGPFVHLAFGFIPTLGPLGISKAPQRDRMNGTKENLPNS